MSELIKLSEVLDALASMEKKLFKGKSNVDNPHLPPSLRLMSVFAIAYVNNFYPPESELLIKSYKLLQEKGYYYHVE